jgi:hypothetical protein
LRGGRLDTGDLGLNQRNYLSHALDVLRHSAECPRYLPYGSARRSDYG